LRQPSEPVLPADASQRGIGLPSPQALPDRCVDSRIVAEALAPPGEVLAEPCERLPAPAGALLVVQLVRVQTLRATGLRGCGGVMALLVSKQALPVLRYCEQFATLNARLPAILRGVEKPAGADEQIDLARVCTLKKLHATAATFYRDAFTAEPKSVQNASLG